MSDTLEEVYLQGGKTKSMKLKQEEIQQKVKEMVPKNRSKSKNKLP